MSTQFKLAKYLGLSEDEIRKNELLWAEENAFDVDAVDDTTSADLRQVGVRPLNF